jgi:hypothetical protein
VASILLALSVSTLGGHVRDVVRLGSEKEMGWIHASRIITVVKNAKSQRNWSAPQLVGYPVGTFHCAFSIPFGTKRPVSIAIDIAKPLPAIGTR